MVSGINCFRRVVRVKSFALVFGAVTYLWAGAPSFDEARKLYQISDFDGSLQILNELPVKTVAVWELIGRNRYGQADFKKATDALEKALALDPGNAEVNLWLGRAYGRRAETALPITAPGYASKARQYFEKAAQLNPNNLEAQSDLFEYYLEAPGFLGGGLDKAALVAERMSRISQSEGYWAQAKLAEKRKEFRSAEAHLKRAIEAAPQQVGRFIDLARLLTKQGKTQEADQSLACAEEIAPNSPKLMYAKAEIYIKSKRNLEVARELLKRYLSLPLTPEDPSRADAEKLLKQAQGS
jgi:tetratricopeptide (TPR) repeat protein